MSSRKAWSSVRPVCAWLMVSCIGLGSGLGVYASGAQAASQGQEQVHTVGMSPEHIATVRQAHE